MSRTPSGWEPGAGRVPVSGGDASPLSCPGSVCHPLLLQDVRGAFSEGGIGERGVGGLLNSVPTLPSSPFPLASAPPPVSSPGPLNLITFPDIGWFLAAEGRARVGGEECPCVFVRARARVNVCGGGGCGCASAQTDSSANFGEGTSREK